MHRTVCLAMAVVCCLAVPAMGTVTIVAGDHDLLPNTAGQVVQVTMSSDVPLGLSSADLGLQIVDPGGGSPVMTAIDIISAGTVFGDAPLGNTGQVDFEPFPTINQLTTTATTDGATPTSGILANVTIDTTGIGPGELFAFNLVYEPFFLDTSTVSIPTQPTVLSTSARLEGANGSLLTIPEPSSIVLGLFAAAGMALVAVRRRRIRK